MKKKFLWLFIATTIAVELVITNMYIRNKLDYKNDTTAINQLVKELEMNYGEEDKYPRTFGYTIIDSNENLLFKTQDGLSESLNDAYRNKDTIVDINVNGDVQKVIIDNHYADTMQKTNRAYINTILTICMVQIIAFIIYYLYLYVNLIKPFKAMKSFASRVTEGNLDIPLTMDKKNSFGAFTEAFDIMRYEIKKSRAAEKKAIESKKELVAKLSHDIKTPIASIKSSSELGLATTQEDRSKSYFELINHKSDQINNLINNLFNATLDELEELPINASEMRSGVIKELIKNADYLKKNDEYSIPDCIVFADRLRLQQVFDNVFANSYKYANTDIKTNVCIKENSLIITIRDFGSGVEAEELPLLMEKFKRGANTQSKEGAGLGLYISKELLKKMEGNLEIENANPGFAAKIYLRTI